MAYTTPYFSNYMRGRKTGSDFLSDYNAHSPQGLDLMVSKRTPDLAPLSEASAMKKENFLSDLNFGKIGAGVSSGLSAFAQGQAATYDFSVDQNAGLKGSAQGYASAGPLGAVLGGIMGQAGTFSQVNKNLKKLDTGVNLIGETGYGAPAYMGAGYLEANKKIASLDDGLDSTKTIFEGGKGIDIATSMFNNLFGTSDKIWEKRQRLERNRTQAQRSFNDRRESFEQRERAMDDYYQRLNTDTLLSNLYY